MRTSVRYSSLQRAFSVRLLVAIAVLSAGLMQGCKGEADPLQLLSGEIVITSASFVSVGDDPAEITGDVTAFSPEAEVEAWFFVTLDGGASYRELPITSVGAGSSGGAATHMATIPTGEPVTISWDSDGVGLHTVSSNTRIRMFLRDSRVTGGATGPMPPPDTGLGQPIVGEAVVLSEPFTIDNRGTNGAPTIEVVGDTVTYTSRWQATFAPNTTVQVRATEPDNYDTVSLTVRYYAAASTSPTPPPSLTFTAAPTAGPLGETQAISDRGGTVVVILSYSGILPYGQRYVFDLLAEDPSKSTSSQLVLLTPPNSRPVLSVVNGGTTEPGLQTEYDDAPISFEGRDGNGWDPLSMSVSFNAGASTVSSVPAVISTTPALAGPIPTATVTAPAGGVATFGFDVVGVRIPFDVVLAFDVTIDDGTDRVTQRVLVTFPPNEPPTIRVFVDNVEIFEPFSAAIRNGELIAIEASDPYERVQLAMTFDRNNSRSDIPSNLDFTPNLTGTPPIATTAADAGGVARITIEATSAMLAGFRLNFSLAAFDPVQVRQTNLLLEDDQKKVYMIDRSGSMASGTITSISPVRDSQGNVIPNPTPFQAAQYQVSQQIQSLRPEDTFDIVYFAGTFTICFNALTQADNAGKATGIAFLYSATAAGGTNFYPPLNLIFNGTSFTGLTEVNIISDGVPSDRAAIQADLPGWISNAIATNVNFRIVAEQWGGGSLNSFMVWLSQQSNTTVQLIN